MALQVIHVDEGNPQRAGESLRETHADEQRAHQSWATGKGDGRQLFLGDTRLLNRLIHHRHHILLMRTRSQFRHHTAIGLVHCLRSRHVRQQHAILQHRRRCIVTRTFDT